MDYIIRTLQSHHWGHCECTEYFPHQENCKEIDLEIYECTSSVQVGIWIGTLSMFLQCICSVPAWYTTPCPQWYLLNPSHLILSQSISSHIVSTHLTPVPSWSSFVLLLSLTSSRSCWHYAMWLAPALDPSMQCGCYPHFSTLTTLLLTSLSAPYSSLPSLSPSPPLLHILSLSPLSSSPQLPTNQSTPPSPKPALDLPRVLVYQCTKRETKSESNSQLFTDFTGTHIRKMGVEERRQKMARAELEAEHSEEPQKSTSGNNSNISSEVAGTSVRSIY